MLIYLLLVCTAAAVRTAEIKKSARTIEARDTPTTLRTHPWFSPSHGKGTATPVAPTTEGRREGEENPATSCRPTRNPTSYDRYVWRRRAAFRSASNGRRIACGIRMQFLCYCCCCCYATTANTPQQQQQVDGEDGANAASFCGLLHLVQRQMRTWNGTGNGRRKRCVRRLLRSSRLR